MTALSMPVYFIAFAIAGFLLSIGLLVWAAVIHQKLKTFFGGSKAPDLEKTILEMASHVHDLQRSEEEQEKTLVKIREQLDGAIQKVGMVRFNPFDDAGGDQSFAIALLDTGDNGVVFTSLYSREGVRVYAKPIERGRSSYTLLEEELKAIEKARL